MLPEREWQWYLPASGPASGPHAMYGEFLDAVVPTRVDLRSDSPLRNLVPHGSAHNGMRGECHASLSKAGDIKQGWLLLGLTAAYFALASSACTRLTTSTTPRASDSPCSSSGSDAMDLRGT